MLMALIRWVLFLGKGLHHFFQVLQTVKKYLFPIPLCFKFIQICYLHIFIRQKCSTKVIKLYFNASGYMRQTLLIYTSLEKYIFILNDKSEDIHIRYYKIRYTQNVYMKKAIIISTLIVMPAVSLSKMIIENSKSTQIGINKMIIYYHGYVSGWSTWKHLTFYLGCPKSTQFV